MLNPVSEDDLYFSPEMIQRIKDYQQEIKEGKYLLTALKKWINTFSLNNVQNCFIEKVEKDLYSLLKSEPKVYKKAVLLLKEIELYPRTVRVSPR